MKLQPKRMPVSIDTQLNKFAVNMSHADCMQEKALLLLAQRNYRKLRNIFYTVMLAFPTHFAANMIIVKACPTWSAFHCLTTRSIPSLQLKFWYLCDVIYDSFNNSRTATIWIQGYNEPGYYFLLCTPISFFLYSLFYSNWSLKSENQLHLLAMTS